jgi:hypothetical protein
MPVVRLLFFAILLLVSPLVSAHVGTHQDLSLSQALMHVVTQIEHVIFLVLVVLFILSLHRIKT